MARNLGYGHHVEPPEVLSYAIGLFSRLEVVVAVQRRVEAGAWTPDQVFHLVRTPIAIWKRTTILGVIPLTSTMVHEVPIDIPQI